MQDNFVQNQQQSTTAPGRKNSNLDKDNLFPDTKSLNTTGTAGFKPASTPLMEAFSSLGRSTAQPTLSNAAAQNKATNLPAQKMVDKGVKEEEKVQMKAGSQQSSGGNSMSQSGSLPSSVLGKMEGAFNTNFNDVKVHSNSSSATNMGALAYAQGNDIHFAPGQYNPNSTKGQELIGHELTHVVQQRQGRVKANTQAKGTPVNDDPRLEKEADEMGKRAVQGGKVSVKSKSDATPQFKRPPWGQILDTYGREGMALEISNKLDLIRTKKSDIADVWSANADAKDFKPGAFMLELALTILGAGLTGALGSFAAGAISKITSQVKTDAAVDAYKKVIEIGYSHLQSIVTSQSADLSQDAREGLATSSNTGLKDYYVESAKSMFLHDNRTSHESFTSRLDNMNNETLAFVLYSLNQVFDQLETSHDIVNQQLTLGFLRLQDSVYVSSEAGVESSDSRSQRSEKIRELYRTDDNIAETDARSGQVLVTGPVGGIGEYNSPRISIGNGIVSDLNKNTYQHLKGVRVADMPGSVSFRFWARLPNSYSLCKVWFVKAASGSIYVDMDEDMQIDSSGYNQGREWLARYHMQTDRELTNEEIRNNCANGAAKLYGQVKNMRVNKIMNLDLF